MNIREETAADKQAIWRLNADVFETSAEANLVDALRDSGCEFISLVAENNDTIIGHILFTPVELVNQDHELNIMGLGPMCVARDYQNQGIGSQLVNAGIARCRSIGCHALVVLGHADYYPRFGFVPSTRFGIRSEYPVAEEVFMIKELVADCLKHHTGIIKYHQAFNAV